MPSSRNQDRLIVDALAAVQAAAARVFPKNEFDLARGEFATRVAEFRAQQQKLQQFDEYCNESVAMIRASLERARNKSTE
jgi:hypothetical protein